MQAPWYVYLIGILVALPTYILWAVGAYVLLKALIAWIFMPDATTRPPRKQISVRG